MGIIFFLIWYVCRLIFVIFLKLLRDEKKFKVNFVFASVVQMPLVNVLILLCYKETRKSDCLCRIQVTDWIMPTNLWAEAHLVLTSGQHTLSCGRADVI